MPNNILQEDLADAIVATIVSLTAHFPFIDRANNVLRVEKNQATKYSEGAAARCIVKCLPVPTIDEDSDEDSALSNFRFALEFEGKDPQGARLDRSLLNQAVLTAFGDRGIRMLALLTDSGANRLHNSGELVIANTIEDFINAGPDRYRIVVELHFPCWHCVPFNYPPIPTLLSVNPNTGPAAGGTSVELKGTNFLATSGVTFGGVAATGVTVVDVRTIRCTTPAHAAGAVSVVVTTPSGANIANTLFTYT